MGRCLKPPKKCKAKLVRASASTYRRACPPHSGGQKFTTGKKPFRNQIHHILCEHAITDFDTASIDKEKFEYIKKCLCAVKWDLNKKENLIGLPLKSAYIHAHRTTTPPENLPSHNVDHNITGGYTDEVKDWLHTNIWNDLQATTDPHEVTGSQIVKQLENCIDHFTDIVSDPVLGRGYRKGGTKKCWDNKDKADWADKWYFPFSMAKDSKVRKRSPGRPLRLFIDIS